MKTFPLLAITLVLSFCAAAPERQRPAVPASEPSRFIIIVADGMGPGHLTWAHAMTGQASNFRRFHAGGLMTTHSANSTVTDSAASATAYATGFKTNNRMVSVDPSGRVLETVLERAEKRGLSTGVVTTTDFYDATPAAFASHATDRYDERPEIVRQMLRSGMEVIFGGGSQRFGSDGFPDLASTAASNGYTLVTTRGALDLASGSRILAAFPTAEQELDWPEAPLPVLAAKAISLLSTDPQGFFLMIEHEGVDGASHSNASENVAAALRSLNQVVGQALDFAAADGRTLVILVGDHETGGLSLFEGDGPGGLTAKWSTRNHTGSVVPLLAWGPGAAQFSGMTDNTDIAKKLFALME